MTNWNSATGLRDSAKLGLTAKRLGRRAGTTLVEILVVIVIFLIGILAVVQIFPRGFRLLITTRNNSVATALGRDAMERLKSSPEGLPDEIVPIRYSGGQFVVDTTINPLDLGPLGDSIGADGRLTRGGSNGIKWQLASGPNVARRILGEGQRLPAPRYLGNVGADAATRAEGYGSLMVLAHGPVDPTFPIVAYANDLTRTLGAPRETRLALASEGVTDTSVGLTMYDAAGNATNFTATEAKIVTPVAVAPFEFFVVNSGTQLASILVPANHQVPRTYRIRMSAYVGNSGTYKRYDYVSLSVRVPVIAEVGVNLVRVPLANLIANTNEIKGGGVLASIEAETVQVAPQYVNVDARTGSLKGVWTSSARISGGSDYTPIDPFEFKVRDGNLGVLLFSPAGRDGAVSRPGGVSEPLLARVDYDVRDWRIIGEDFRVVNENANFVLSLQSLKVGSNAGPDGLPNDGLFGSTNAWDPTASPRDNVVVLDLTTGYEVQRAASSKTDASGRAYADTESGTEPASVYLGVDKSKGTVTLRDADPSTPKVLDVRLIPPTGPVITTPAANRTFRVLYRAREEWAVQLLKGASQYSVVNVLGSLAPNQAFVGDTTGGTLRTRLYFPVSEAGRKVTIDRIAYVAKADGSTQLLEGQDFVLKAPKINEPSYAYADVAEVVNTATFSYDYGIPVRGIKGASVTVRVLWNPEAFNLGTDGKENITRLGQWGRGWRKSVTETYLRAEEAR